MDDFERDYERWKNAVVTGEDNDMTRFVLAQERLTMHRFHELDNVLKSLEKGIESNRQLLQAIVSGELPEQYRRTYELVTGRPEFNYGGLVEDMKTVKDEVLSLKALHQANEKERENTTKRLASIQKMVNVSLPLILLAMIVLLVILLL